jgi:hypothetical protein
MNTSSCDQKHNRIAKFVAFASLLTLPAVVAWIVYTQTGQRAKYAYFACIATEIIVCALVGAYVTTFLPGCLDDDTDDDA